MRGVKIDPSAKKDPRTMYKTTLARKILVLGTNQTKMAAGR